MTMPVQAAGEAKARVMTGSCEALTIGGRPSTPGCRPRLIAVTYGTGAVSFVFTDRFGGLVSFHGRPAQQVGDQTTILLTQMTTAGRGHTQAAAVPARGSCVLTPFAPDRARLECNARSRNGSFSGLFRTNGLAEVALRR